MKKNKSILTLIVITLMVIIVVGIGNKKIIAADKEYYTLDSLSTTTNSEDGSLYYSLGYNHAFKSNNVFCVEHGKQWGQKGWFKVRTKIEIANGKAKFIQYNNLGTEEEKSGYSNNSEQYPDNVLAAIVCDSEMELRIWKLYCGNKYI